MFCKPKKRVEFDNWLRKCGFYRKSVPKDESSFFRAVSEQVYFSQKEHEKLRLDCVQHAKNNKKFQSLIDGHYEEYLSNLCNHFINCGHTEMFILSDMLERDFIVFNTENYEIENVTKNGFEKKIYLCELKGHHYDTVVTLSNVDASCACQSLMYELLYKNVFNIDNPVEMAIEKLLNHNLAQDKVSIEDLNVDMENNNSCVKTNELSFRVAKSLHPNIYRNIDYDTWVDIRREIRSRDWYTGDDNLKVGTRCILNKPNVTYHCYIQEFLENKSKCLVYVEELAKKIVVGYDELKMLPSAQPWARPHRKNKTSTDKNSNFIPPTDVDASKTETPDSETHAAIPNEETIDQNQDDFPSCENNLVVLSAPNSVDLNEINNSNDKVICPKAHEHTQAFVSLPFMPEIPPKSYNPNGQDLPWHDVNMLQYFFNLGVDYANLHHEQAKRPFFPKPLQTSQICSISDRCDMYMDSSSCYVKHVKEGFYQDPNFNQTGFYVANQDEHMYQHPVQVRPTYPVVPSPEVNTVTTNAMYFPPNAVPVYPMYFPVTPPMYCPLPQNTDL